MPEPVARVADAQQDQERRNHLRRSADVLEPYRYGAAQTAVVTPLQRCHPRVGRCAAGTIRHLSQSRSGTSASRRKAAETGVKPPERYHEGCHCQTISLL